jgi:thioredoxin
MKQVKTNEFEAEVLKAEGQVLVDFWAPWCGPCRAQGPILEELASETAGELKIVKVNVDEEPALASAYGVASIPTLLFFKNGRPVNKAVGLHSADDLKAMMKA